MAAMNKRIARVSSLDLLAPSTPLLTLARGARPALRLARELAEPQLSRELSLNSRSQSLNSRCQSLNSRCQSLNSRHNSLQLLANAAWTYTLPISPNTAPLFSLRSSRRSNPAKELTNPRPTTMPPRLGAAIMQFSPRILTHHAVLSRALTHHAVLSCSLTHHAV